MKSEPRFLFADTFQSPLSHSSFKICRNGIHYVVQEAATYGQSFSKRTQNLPVILSNFVMIHTKGICTRLFQKCIMLLAH